jgi:GT2 family glycosyltransferase
MTDLWVIVPAYNEAERIAATLDALAAQTDRDFTLLVVDRTFLNRVRRTTTAIVHNRAMVVENSTRRLRAYGVVGTAKWYLDRGSGALTADPR